MAEWTYLFIFFDFLLFDFVFGCWSRLTDPKLQRAHSHQFLSSPLPPPHHFFFFKYISLSTDVEAIRTGITRLPSAKAFSRFGFFRPTGSPPFFSPPSPISFFCILPHSAIDVHSCCRRPSAFQKKIFNIVREIHPCSAVLR